jgi:uncharacterized protein (TIGR00661 family)
MKILYAIQGTGNGHLSRAMEIVPLLKRKVETDVLVSGNQSSLPFSFNVDHRMNGLSFISGKNGGVDLLGTWSNLDTRRLHKEINELPISRYDLVITDFEPISAWAAKLNNVPCIELSHQAAVLNKRSPRPVNADLLGRMILSKYCPAPHRYGFHFDRYDDNIFTPVIRKAVRECTVTDEGHYTVYLPSYSDEYLHTMLERFDHINWHVFTKQSMQSCKVDNITYFPIDSENFLKSMAASSGVLCGAGFETPAEALFMRKKLMVIPMKNQFEQQCNAEALQRMGVRVIPVLKDQYLDEVSDWTRSKEYVYVEYADQTEFILDEILNTHLYGQPQSQSLKLSLSELQY